MNRLDLGPPLAACMFQSDCGFADVWQPGPEWEGKPACHSNKIRGLAERAATGWAGNMHVPSIRSR